ncbi:tRNA (guanosine(37)-N1)-methyltransferase TrmD [Patescibacteria group bacterium]|nr:tRNA (guanosine(37)-N1)-methyltransferase TrmD [Patescibacteria group bacterium]
MKFHFLTIFPEMVQSYLSEAMLKRAAEKKLVSFGVLNIRDYTLDKHGKVDERPYGGGPGMVMTPEPILRAYSKLKFIGRSPTSNLGKTKVIMLSPTGKMFTNAMAAKMAKSYTDVVFICGRYEGVDDRVRSILKAEEVSIGDFVLTGGELPALVMTDAIVRQISGVLGKGESVEENRTASPRVFTRPPVLEWPKAKKATKTLPEVKAKNHKVPDVLISGDHKKIEEWRKNQQKTEE